jgi:tetratricopeptide (TPR) repeat protein
MTDQPVDISSRDPKNFHLWTPGPDRGVETGPDRQAVPLPPIPLPVHPEDIADGEPTDDAIGRGVYDYLRRYPDCPGNQAYAELLRDAFPHYLAELGAQIVMLEHKEVDVPYIRRKLAAMQILALLEPGNAGLLQQMGKTCYELGLMFPELGDCRSYLLKAMGYLQKSLRVLPDNPMSLNYLGQIDYLFGDYPSAIRRWNGVLALVENPDTRREEEGHPEYPLIDDLEAVGLALAAYEKGDIAEARSILERLEESGRISGEFSWPEFHYLLGMCRGKLGDAAGAFAAFDRALEIEPEFRPAAEARERILEKGGI